MKHPKPIDLDKLSDDKLLSLRFCDLKLTIEGTWLEECISQLYKELEEKKISFRPPCYLPADWLCTDSEPVIGIAFYLAHPRLQKLEKKMMLEVEGGNRDYCMKLLRHEAGHTLNYAYLLHKKKKWRGARQENEDIKRLHEEWAIANVYRNNDMLHVTNTERLVKDAKK